MKASILIAIIALSAFPLSGQNTSQPASPAAAKKSPNTLPMRRVESVPANLRLPRELRSSTAQTAAVRVNKPQPHTLPDFSILNADGFSVSSHSLEQKTHWLLLYRRDNCLACDRLMNTLAAGSGVSAGKAPAFAIVIAGKDKTAFNKVRANFANLSHAVWVSDPTDQSTAALKLHVAPVLYGMQGSTIVWSLSGNLSNSALVERQTSAWVTTSSTTTPPTPATTAATTTGK